MRIPDRHFRTRPDALALYQMLWELRVGDYQVFYDVSPDSGTVIIVAVGRKDHNRLWIGGEEIDL